MAASKLTCHMFPSLSASRFILLLATLLFSNIMEVNGINCYTCQEAASNDECNKPEHLQDCVEISPPGREYDTCMTKVWHTANDGIKISKECKSGPCALGDDQTAALGLDCDRSKSDWQCDYCCNTDECNESGAQQVIVSFAALICPLLSLIGFIAGGHF